MKKLRPIEFAGWAVVDKASGDLALFGGWLRVAAADGAWIRPTTDVAGTRVVPVVVTIQPSKQKRKKVRA